MALPARSDLLPSARLAVARGMPDSSCISQADLPGGKRPFPIAACCPAFALPTSSLNNPRAPTFLKRGKNNIVTAVAGSPGASPVLGHGAGRLLSELWLGNPSRGPDPAQAEAQPSSKVHSTPVKLYLRKGRKHQTGRGGGEKKSEEQQKEGQVHRQQCSRCWSR